MDKDDNVENRVGIEMNQLDLVVVKESAEEITDWDTEPMLEEGGEHHNLISIGCRDVLPSGKAPMKHHAVWEKMVHNKLAHFIFIRYGQLEKMRMRGDHV
jgi:hypothetical protein